MGMRTIRWRNGQCPRRNGQWAERIAHAGSEAVRLVPFSSLPAVILDYLLSECCSRAWRLPLCRDAVRITISIELVAIFHAFRRDSGALCRARVLLGRSVRARAELYQKCAFDGAYVALEEQRPEWSAVRVVLRTLAAYGGRRCSI